jgi:hypothetical protein
MVEVRGRCDHTPTPQTDKTTDSVWGEGWG